jgi:hypothetical protein
VDIQTEENGDETVTVLRNLTKLYLPESAKYNCNELPAFYAKATGVDMKMGGIAYNTLREVPDALFRTILKNTFPSLFVGDQIDISKRLVASGEVTQSIVSTDMDAKISAVDDVEGFQYVLGNKGYMGGFINIVTNDICTVPYFPVSLNVGQIVLSRISTPNGIDVSRATNLYYLSTIYNPAIETLDLSASTALGQRGDGSGDNIIFRSCDNLKTVSFPAAAKVLSLLDFVNCPSLEKVDLSQFETLNTLGLGLLPASCKITYLTSVRLFNGTTKMKFGMDEAIWNRPETKAFLDAYHGQCMLRSMPGGHGAKTYVWTSNY